MEHINKKICEIMNCIQYEDNISGPEFGLALIIIPLIVGAMMLALMRIIIVAKKSRGF
jgi:hypothetical protein